MEFFDAEAVQRGIDPPALVEALRAAFAAPDSAVVPERGHFSIDESLEATLLVMPAWQRGRWLGVKVVGHYPQNRARGLPGLYGSYLLASATTGEPVAVLDGTELTRWRTAAASALAADRLAIGLVMARLRDIAERLCPEGRQLVCAGQRRHHQGSSACSWSETDPHSERFRVASGP